MPEDSVEKEAYVEFGTLQHAGRFKAYTVQTIISVLGRFFRCSIDFIESPREFALGKYGINILDNTNRGTYPIDDGEAFVLARVLQDDCLVSAFGVRLYNGDFSGLTNLLNSLEGTLTRKVSGAFPNGFRSVPLGFGNRLCEQIITHYCAKGRYDYRSFQLLISEFKKLSGSTFEDNPFTTGLILTRSLFAFKKDESEEHGRLGTAHRLETTKKLAYTPTLDVRFWYLANGLKSFYVADKNLRITHIYFPNRSASNLPRYIEDRTLEEVLYGGDSMFKVVSNNEFTVTSSDGLEFVFQGGYWRLRAFDQIRKTIADSVDLNDDVAASVIEIALELSAQRRSALLVIPRDAEAVADLSISSHSLTQEPLHIDDHRPVLYRIATSDGATVINSKGFIESFGCIIDTNIDSSREITGTGENAAESLSEHALAIKVSQDGMIKLIVQGYKTVV